MPTELTPWISTAVIVGVMLYLHQVTRQDIKGLHGEISDLRNCMDAGFESLRDQMDNSLGSFRDCLDAGNGDLGNRMSRLEERMAGLEGTLDVIRQFLVRNGRGNAA